MTKLGVLVTGGYGFVGTHLVQALSPRAAWIALLDHPDASPPPSEGQTGPSCQPVEPDIFQICADITLEADIQEALTDLVEKNGPPDLVYHLAGQASAADAFRCPAQTYHVNVVGTAILLQAISRLAPEARVLIPSSAHVYGPPGPDGFLREEDLARPSSYYGASKAAQEEVARIFWEADGLRTYVARSFNHIGPGQSPGFVVADFASRLADLERRGGGVLRVGNLSAKRDYLDVRDVVSAYATILTKGHAGMICNVASGTPRSAAELLHVMVAEVRVPIQVEEDPDLLRKVDMPLLAGDSGRLRSLGWQPRYGIRDTLRETLDYWRLRTQDKSEPEE
jgi:GDP-4-dehydro-6-deoxy-D-mannose reductase